MKKAGFTLIELLLVIIIIGIFISFSFVSYQYVLKNSRQTRRKADLEQLRSALEQYRSVNENYPSTGGAWWGYYAAFWIQAHSDNGASGWIPNLAPTYIAVLPHMPKEQTAMSCSDTADSEYVYISDGVDFKLLAHCGIEIPIQTTDPYYDPVRPTWALQVSTAGVGAKGW